jgi:hypothetical protein
MTLGVASLCAKGIRDELTTARSDPLKVRLPPPDELPLLLHCHRESEGERGRGGSGGGERDREQRRSDEGGGRRLQVEGGRWGKEGRRGVILRVSLGRGRWAVGLAGLVQLCRVSIFRPTAMLFFQKLL